MAFPMVCENAVNHVSGLESSTELSAISPVSREASTMWSVCTVNYVPGLYRRTSVVMCLARRCLPL
jgi:hypothetical protein